MRNCTVKMITVRTHEVLGSSRFRSAALRGQDEEAKTHAATVSGIFRSRIAYYMQVAIFFSYIIGRSKLIPFHVLLPSQ